MNIISPVTGAPETLVSSATAIVSAAEFLLARLETGAPVDAALLRAAMEQAFGASDASGAWTWKDGYDACEGATVLFLRKYGKALFRRSPSALARLAALTKIAGLLPSHTRRSEESHALQQFSTPAPLALAALVAAGVSSADIVLEPSAGTGLLAIMAEIAGAGLILNELANQRADLLSLLFQDNVVSRFDAAQIDDYLGAGTAPTVVLMNPPFSALAYVEGRVSMTNPSAQPNKWKKEGRIFAVRHRGVDYFPGYALDARAGYRPLKGLAKVLAIFEGRKDDWGLAYWFSSANSFLGGKRPQDVLGVEPERVASAAEDELAGVAHG